MGEKRYHWLKLKDDFFNSKRIKKLRKLAGGDTYTIIYLKMQLVAMKHDGVITFTGLEKSFADELALELDENPENVTVTVQYLLSCGLLETSDDIHFFIPYAVENTQSESASTQRSRLCRERQKALQCNNDATPMQRSCNDTQQNCSVDIDIEKDIDIDTEIDIEKDLTVPNGTVCRTGDVRRIVDAWNSLGLSQIQKITGTSNRGGMLRARVNEYGVEAVVNAVLKVKNSSFLRGQNKKGWVITFDWFVRPNNFVKVMEGQYDDSIPVRQSLKDRVQTDYGSPMDFYE